MAEILPISKLGRFAVVNTQIVCFIGNDTTFTDQDKTDVINSTLLAQLSASEKAKSYAHVEEWLNSFIQIAAVTGWTLQSGSSFKEATHEQLKTTIDLVAATFIGKSEHNNDLRVLQALLYLRGAESPVGLDILDENGKSKTAGTFQFVICEKTEDKEASVLLSDLLIRIFPYAFETIETVVSAILQPIIKGDTYKMKYMLAPTVAVLNMDVYSSVRDAVANKVQGYVDDLVAFLPI